MAATDWQSWCAAVNGIAVDGTVAIVSLGDGRSQRVSVVQHQDHFELLSVVARSALLQDLSQVELRAWRRNRSAQMVGFLFDDRGRLLARCWLPTTGLTSDEFRSSVLHVAAEADLFEYQLTGADRE